MASRAGLFYRLYAFSSPAYPLLYVSIPPRFSHSIYGIGALPIPTACAIIDLPDLAAELTANWRRHTVCALDFPAINASLLRS